MGNALMASEQNQKKESVINLSDHCVNRLTQKVERDADDDEDNFPLIQEFAEEQWVDRLECMDEDHSINKGINHENVVHLISKIEGELQDIRPPICDTDELIHCLKKNEKCIIKCKKYVDKFISCVDAQRINIIKEKYDLEKKVSNMKGSDLAKQFIKEEA